MGTGRCCNRKQLGGWTINSLGMPLKAQAWERLTRRSTDSQYVQSVEKPISSFLFLDSQTVKCHYYTPPKIRTKRKLKTEEKEEENNCTKQHLGFECPSYKERTFFYLRFHWGCILKNDGLVRRKEKNINVLTTEQIGALIISSWLSEEALNIHVSLTAYFWQGFFLFFISPTAQTLR